MLEHGETKTKLYKVWRGMKQRCERDSSYTRRNIKVCDEWLNSYEKFKDNVAVLEHFGEEGYSLDRIDNDKGYEPNNVRWATAQEQSRNTSKNRMITFNGKTMCLKAWAEELNVAYNALQSRLRMGWTVEETLTRPIKRHKRVV